MNRSTLALAVLLVISVVANIGLFWSNTTLQMALVAAEAKADAAPPPVPAPAVAVRPAGDPARKPGGKPRKGQKARPPRDADAKRAAAGEVVDGGENLRNAAMRAGLRDQIREGIIATLYDTADARGWDPGLTSEAEAIVSTSFDSQEELREKVRAGEIPWAEGKPDLVAIREAANDELLRILGDEEYDIFLATLRGEDGGVEPGEPLPE